MERLATTLFFLPLHLPAVVVEAVQLQQVMVAQVVVHSEPHQLDLELVQPIKDLAAVVQQQQHLVVVVAQGLLELTRPEQLPVMEVLAYQVQSLARLPQELEGAAVVC
jgi:hypothetical protein